MTLVEILRAENRTGHIHDDSVLRTTTKGRLWGLRLRPRFSNDDFTDAVWEVRDAAADGINAGRERSWQVKQRVKQ